MASAKPRLQVLFEDNHLLVLNKPSGLATMGVAAGDDSLLERARQYIKQKYQKPGNVYLGVVSRLDRPVSGAIVFARTSKAASRLTEQFREAVVDKRYWAIVSPAPATNSGTWVDWLWKDERRKRMLVVERQQDAQQARLGYVVRRRDRQRYAWLEILLETGRKHQIRAQCAYHGCPVVGDRRYGSKLTFPAGIALHARSLGLRHPTRNERLIFEAPLPEAWKKLAAEVGCDFES
jgi:23S rRNA pseudouridine1911/1915/1917 synthase